MPTLSLGEPRHPERHLTEEIDGLTIFYPPALRARPDRARITVRLRKLFFLRWLELEGARAIPRYEGE